MKKSQGKRSRESLEKLKESRLYGWRRLTVALFCLLLLEILLLAYGTIVFQGEAAYLYDVHFFRKGLRPYSEFRVPQGPMILAAYFAVGKLGSTGIWDARVLSGFYLAVALLLLSRMTFLERGWAGTAAFLLLQMCFPLSLQHSASLVGPYVLALLLLVVAVWSVVDPVLGDRIGSLSFGFFGILAVASRIVFLLPLGLLILLFNKRESGFSLYLTILGGISAFGALFLFLVPANDLASVFDQMVRVYWLSKVAHPVEGVGFDVVGRIFHILRFGLLPLAGLVLTVGIEGVLLIAEKRNALAREERGKPVESAEGKKGLAETAFVAGMGTLLAHFVVHPFYAQYFSMVVPWLVMAALLSLFRLWENKRRMVVGILAGVLLANAAADIRAARALWSLGSSQLVLTQKIGKKLRTLFPGTKAVICDVTAFSWEAGFEVPVGTERGLATDWFELIEKVAALEPNLLKRYHTLRRRDVELLIRNRVFEGVILTETQWFDEEIRNLLPSAGYKRIATLNGGRWGRVECYRLAEPIRSKRFAAHSERSIE
ncbi:MAG: hypothetical protein D6679_00750 [Candidatus Hydrogenedentota bacterium]|nr:MAG: hypothetical protein D6679_00750 [Candidatus Hydrogenedentota bacterium]